MSVTLGLQIFNGRYTFRTESEFIISDKYLIRTNYNDANELH